MRGWGISQTFYVLCVVRLRFKNAHTHVLLASVFLLVLDRYRDYFGRFFSKREMYLKARARFGFSKLCRFNYKK